MADVPDATRRSSRLHPPFSSPGEKLPSISDFLDHAPQSESQVANESVDRIPSITQFLAGEQEVDADGWAVAGWQSYDWSGVAGLASGQAPSEREDADAVASAFDVIARRIRSGELSIDQFRGTPPEATLAAALGAMLKFRR